MPRSTRSFLFPDTNVWVALTYEGHVHHVRSRNWLASVPTSARLFFCRITQLGLLRLLSSEAVMKTDMMNQEDAWKAYDRWFEDDRIGFADEAAGLDPIFRSLSGSRLAAPTDWADSYLAAFAIASQLSLVTFDRALQRKARQALLLNP